MVPLNIFVELQEQIAVMNGIFYIIGSIVETMFCNAFRRKLIKNCINFTGNLILFYTMTVQFPWTMTSITSDELLL